MMNIKCPALRSICQYIPESIELLAEELSMPTNGYDDYIANRLYEFALELMWDYTDKMKSQRGPSFADEPEDLPRWMDLAMSNTYDKNKIYSAEVIIDALFDHAADHDALSRQDLKDLCSGFVEDVCQEVINKQSHSLANHESHAQ